MSIFEVLQDLFLFIQSYFLDAHQLFKRVNPEIKVGETITAKSVSAEDFAAMPLEPTHFVKEKRLYRRDDFGIENSKKFPHNPTLLLENLQYIFSKLLELFVDWSQCIKNSSWQDLKKSVKTLASVLHKTSQSWEESKRQSHTDGAAKAAKLKNFNNLVLKYRQLLRKPKGTKVPKV
jgi:hypothetical protein